MDDATREIVVDLLRRCLDGDVDARVLVADMYYKKDDPIRPLWFKKREDGELGDPLENLSGCKNAQLLFDFARGGFDGKKPRTIIVINV